MKRGWMGNELAEFAEFEVTIFLRGLSVGRIYRVLVALDSVGHLGLGCRWDLVLTQLMREEPRHWVTAEGAHVSFDPDDLLLIEARLVSFSPEGEMGVARGVD